MRLFTWATGGDVVSKILNNFADIVERKYITGETRERTGKQVAADICEALRETAKTIR